jgi:hypothetical protein
MFDLINIYLNKYNDFNKPSDYYNIQTLSGKIICKIRYDNNNNNDNNYKMNLINKLNQTDNIKINIPENNVINVSDIDHNKKIIMIYFIDLSKIPIFKNKGNLTQITDLNLFNIQMQ